MKPKLKARTSKVCIVSFYKFIKIDDLFKLQNYLNKICLNYKLLGTILLASEGINGTISGKEKNINKFFNQLEKDNNFKSLEKKISYNTKPAFHRMKVRLKDEIVKMGEKDVNPAEIVGEYISPDKWNNIITDPQTILIDIRNFYESAIGTFKGAIKPETESFSQFPSWFEKNINTLNKNKKNIAMFCTGGIRCEKATAYAINKGYKNIFHLKGGILKYLEKVPKTNSLWDGECFVFDERVSVKHSVIPGSFSMCHACRMPITKKDKKKKSYVKGVSCYHCVDKTSIEKKRRYADRQKQMELAAQRGEIHIGKSFK